MAKRELSSTLKNLKFMQRGTQREEKIKKVEEELIPGGNFPSSSTPKKCVVIMEGDPHPGVTRGRMSFQSFNPSVDKLNEEADNIQQPESSITSSGNQVRGSSNRENGSAQDGSESSKVDRNNGDANGDLKRKQTEVISEIPYPNKSPETVRGDSSSRSSHKKHKREKLDWNVLRPPRSQDKRG